MIWRNAELYNVSELLPENGRGYGILRYPHDTAKYLSTQGQKANRCCSGCEIRFKIKSGKVKITLSVDEREKTQACTRLNLYYGGIVAGWADCFKNVFSYPTEIVIAPPVNPGILRKIHSDNGILYSPELVRVILQNRRINIYDIEGDIEPPCEEDVPKLKYLAYGSSITHGSLGLLQVNTWTNRVAENLGADLTNLGLAGSARMEPEVADYIAYKTKFDFATLEMGINVLDMEPTEFRQRIKYFVSTIANAHPDKLIFCIDLFFCESDILQDGKAVLFREIVKNVLMELRLPNTIHVNGLDVLTTSAGLSGDYIHPNNRGVEEMAKNLTEIISKGVK